MAMWASTGTKEQRWEEGVWDDPDPGTRLVVVVRDMVAPATWLLYGQVDVELW